VSPEFAAPVGCPTDAIPTDRAAVAGRLRPILPWPRDVDFGGPIATVGYMQRDLVRSATGSIDRTSSMGCARARRCPPVCGAGRRVGRYLQRGAIGAPMTALPFILPSYVSFSSWRCCASTSRDWKSSRPLLRHCTGGDGPPLRPRPDVVRFQFGPIRSTAAACASCCARWRDARYVATSAIRHRPSGRDMIDDADTIQRIFAEAEV